MVVVYDEQMSFQVTGKEVSHHRLRIRRPARPDDNERLDERCPRLGHQFYDTGASGRRGIVDEVSSHETGDLCRVHAGWVSYQAAFAILLVDSVKVALQRRDFRTLDDELFRVPVKTYDVLYKPRTPTKALKCPA